MFTSNMTLIKTFLGLLVVGTMAGCNLPSPQQKEGKSDTSTPATFTAQAKAEQSKALETKVQGTFALPASKVFNFTSCLKDNAYDKIIAGHDFVIEETQQKVTSDKSGCITWDETIPYNFLGLSQYIRIERKIRGLGVHKGIQQVAFAINPWSHGENLPAVLNPDDGNHIPKLVSKTHEAELAFKGYSNKEEIISRPLWVEDGRLFITEQRLNTNKVDLLVEVRPNVSIQLTKMNEEVFLRNLTAGSFTGKLSLIHVYYSQGKEVRRLLVESADMPIQFDNGTLSLKSTLSVSAIPTGGQLMLGLELKPVLAPPGLKGFEGIYLLGDFDQLKGSAFLKLNSAVTETPNFKLREFTNARPLDYKISGATGDVTEEAYQKAKIQVSKLRFDEPHIGEEKTASKEFIYKVTACLKNSLDRKGTLGRTFKISKFRSDTAAAETIENVRSDVDSCITWSERLTYSTFECNHFIKGQIKISNEDLGMNETLQVAINPWDAMGAFGRDLRYVTTEEKLPFNCVAENRAKTFVFMKELSYSTLAYKYSVDAQLNLTLHKKLQIKLDPRIVDYSNIFFGRDDQERKRDGLYLLKIALIANPEYDPNDTYITSSEKIVAVIGGQINTEMIFSTQDLKALGNRNKVLVELYPIVESKVVDKNGVLYPKDPRASLDSLIDTQASLETSTFTGPINLNADESTRPLMLVNAAAIHNYFIENKGQTPHPTKNLIAQKKAEGLKLQAQKIQLIKDKSQKSHIIAASNLAEVSLATADEQNPLAKKLLGDTPSMVRNPVSKSELQGLVSEGVLKNVVAEKLCAFWFNDYFMHLYKNKGGVINKYVKGLGYDCVQAVQKDPRSFFQVEQHMLVKEVSDSTYLQGQNHGLTLGTSFGLTAAHSKYTTQSTSIGAKFGFAKKLFDLISLGLDVAWTMSWATSDANSTSNTININRSTTVTVQQNTYLIRTNKYELCTLVRLNPVLFIKEDKMFFARRNYLESFNQQLTEEEKMTAATRGLMICDGALRTRPMDLTETYYLMTQETATTQGQDNGDPRNRNLFLALRSNNDFNRFLVATKSHITMPASAQKEDDGHGAGTQQMENVFKYSRPSYPGMFRVR